MRSRILEKLQAETRQQHDGMDADARAFIANCTRDGFRDYLVRAYGFESTLESACAMMPGLASHSATTRPRTRYIAHDLEDLGISAERLLELAPFPLPPFRELAEALGRLYVAEQNVLTNERCFHELARRDPELAASATYLHCYEPATAAHWRAFGISLERAATTSDPERIVAAARRAYDQLRSWLRASYSDQAQQAALAPSPAS